MPFYLVRWEIEIDAETPDKAAELARAAQLDKDSLAVNFTIRLADDGQAEWTPITFDPR